MNAVEEYLIAAWKRGAPNADTSRGFPTGFWPDVARVAVEMALYRPLSAQTMASRGDHEARREVKPIKGLDVSKLEFRL